MSRVQSNKNEVIIACAGSGKTSRLVDQALSLPNKRVLFVTYTTENLEQISSYIIERNGCIPRNITLLSWYAFLLQDGVRPYQNLVTGRARTASIYFDHLPEQVRRIAKTNTDLYFFTKNNNVYRDRMADFVCSTDDTTTGAVIKRLEKVYDYILIDEFQDLAGYDLNLIERICKSKISLIAVGDPRQAIFSTNNSAKNAKYKKAGIIDWISERQKSGLITMVEWADSHRCNQEICDFADSLFPNLRKTNSQNLEKTDHDGVFCVDRNQLTAYIAQYKPMILRDRKTVDTLGFPAMNFGISKGRTYDRVVIFPTKPMMEFFLTRDVSKAGDITRLYVAVTRARYSVAFVSPKN